MTTTDRAPVVAVDQQARTSLPRAWVVPLLCALLMLLVGLWGLDRGSMWQDEAATFEVAHRGVGEILAMLRNVDVVHGAYYLLMHVWLLPGGGEVWMRVPSALGMAVAAGAVAAIGVRLAGRAVGLVAGLLFCAAPRTTPPPAGAAPCSGSVTAWSWRSRSPCTSSPCWSWPRTR